MGCCAQAETRYRVNQPTVYLRVHFRWRTFCNLRSRCHRGIASNSVDVQLSATSSWLGRIIASETELPNMLINLVSRS